MLVAAVGGVQLSEWGVAGGAATARAAASALLFGLLWRASPAPRRRGRRGRRRAAAGRRDDRLRLLGARLADADARRRRPAARHGVLAARRPQRRDPLGVVWIALAVALAVVWPTRARARLAGARRCLGGDARRAGRAPPASRRAAGAALATGAAVATAGAIGFVGLVVPHALRPPRRARGAAPVAGERDRRRRVRRRGRCGGAHDRRAGATAGRRARRRDRRADRSSPCCCARPEARAGERRSRACPTSTEAGREASLPFCSRRCALAARRRRSAERCCSAASTCASRAGECWVVARPERRRQVVAARRAGRRRSDRRPAIGPDRRRRGSTTGRRARWPSGAPGARSSGPIRFRHGARDRALAHLRDAGWRGAFDRRSDPDGRARRSSRLAPRRPRRQRRADALRRRAPTRRDRDGAAAGRAAAAARRAGVAPRSRPSAAARRRAARSRRGRRRGRRQPARSQPRLGSRRATSCCSTAAAARGRLARRRPRCRPARRGVRRRDPAGRGGRRASLRRRIGPDGRGAHERRGIAFVWSLANRASREAHRLASASRGRCAPRCVGARWPSSSRWPALTRRAHRRRRRRPRRSSLERPPQRVVTLAPNLTELVFAVGGGATLVGTVGAERLSRRGANDRRASATPAGSTSSASSR